MEQGDLRIRLKFVDPEILSSKQIAEGLGQCWFLLRRADVKRISDVATDIVVYFEIKTSCPNGIGLEVDEFVLPPSQPAYLLKDFDIVRIHRRNDNASLLNAHENGNIYREVINGYGFSRCDIELDTLDEFEKDPEQYECELEEGERVSPNEKAKSLLLPTREKHRNGKKERIVNISEVGKSRTKRNIEPSRNLAIKQARGDTTNALVSRTGPSDAAVALCVLDKAKKKKRKHLEEHENEAIAPEKGSLKKSSVASLGCDGEVVQVEKKHKKSKKLHCESANVMLLKNKEEMHVKFDDGLMEGSKASRKSKKSSSACLSSINEVKPVRESELKEKPVDDKVIAKKSKDAVLKRQAENRHLECNSDDSPLFRTSKDKNKERQVDEPMRPSRSARRKKAKRLWLREQAKLTPFPTVPTGLSECNGYKIPVGSCKAEALPIDKEAVEAEAEEEVLPILVGSGHIRFLSHGDDEASEQHPSSFEKVLQPLRFGDRVKSKRQGQSWGQQKSPGGSKGKKWTTVTKDVESPEVENDVRCNTKSECRTVPFNFDKCPPLLGLPKEGDVLVYRLVELTTSWTPELSPYRVGVVVRLEPGSNNVKLDPHPDFPFNEKNDFMEDEDSVMGQEIESTFPYDETGSLEAEFSALVEVRLVERKLPEHHKSPLKVSEGVLDQVRLVERKLPEHHKSPLKVSEEDPMLLNSQQAHNLPPKPVSEVEPSTAESQGDEDMDRSNVTSFLWQALAAELEQKKMEISQKNQVASVQECNKNSELGMGLQIPDNGPNARESGRSAHDTITREGRKSKYMRSAGVGSIVALLRSQQAL